MTESPLCDPGPRPPDTALAPLARRHGGGGDAAVRPLVWGISPTDPLTFGAAGTLLLLVCAMASLVPAQRAATVDPTVALRSE